MIYRLKPCCTNFGTDRQEPRPHDFAKKEVTRRIKALGKNGQIKKAVNELTEAARIGVPVDTQLATTMVDICARNRKMELAQTLFDDFFGEFVEPDDVTFCSLIRGYGSSQNPDWIEIQKILDRMEKEFEIQPTLNVYNALLEICAARNELDRAEMFIDRMAAQQIAPDRHTLRAVENRRSIRKLVKQLDRELSEIAEM